MLNALIALGFDVDLASRGSGTTELYNTAQNSTLARVNEKTYRHEAGGSLSIR